MSNISYCSGGLNCFDLSCQDRKACKFAKMYEQTYLGKNFMLGVPDPDKLKEGVKFDGDKKLRPELIAPEMIESLSIVLAYGAKKYEDRNWEKGMKWSRPFGALMRHMWAWWKGEDNDPETGFSHLAHAACCIMFLLTYVTRNSGTDDRWKG